MNNSIKSLSFFVLLALSGMLHAEQLVLIWQSPDEGVAQYLDIDNIIYNGDLVEMSRVFNYKPPYLRKVDKNPYASQKILTEFDCESLALRQLSAKWFSGEMGTGTVLNESNDPELWEFGNIDEFTAPLWKIACKR